MKNYGANELMNLSTTISSINVPESRVQTRAIKPSFLWNVTKARRAPGSGAGASSEPVASQHIARIT
jgi:hypothetical protein